MAFSLFEWDPAKAESNLEKHFLSFDVAIEVFESPYLEVKDNRRDYGEPRFNVLGVVDGRVVHLTWTPRGEARRIISARRATRREREIYTEKIGPGA